MRGKAPRPVGAVLLYDADHIQVPVATLRLEVAST